MFYCFGLNRKWCHPGVTWLPAFSMPVCQCDPCRRGVESLPPNSPVTGLTHVGEHCVLDDGRHGVGVGLVRGARSHAEEAVFRVDGPQLTCREEDSAVWSPHVLSSGAAAGAQLSPWLSNFIQAMSSPTHSTFQPGRDGFIMAKLVFPQALGKAAATYRFTPWGLVMPRIWEDTDDIVWRTEMQQLSQPPSFTVYLTSMCSASQPSSLAMREAMRRAKHFFPSRELPP